jgi:amidohydrolase
VRGRDWSTSTLVILAFVYGAFGARCARAENALLPAFTERLESERAELIELRHDIHRHPETSGNEERTSGLVAERLRGLGFEVTTGVGGHGVIGVLRGGAPGPVAAFRADMDAVPSDAPDPVEFRSLTPGVRHICGHDVHTTVGVALAEGLASIKDRLPGTVMLLFQPAEETASGAKAMLADGALDNPKPDAIFAYHTAPFNVGQVAVAAGRMMAGRDLVRVTVERAADPEATAAAVRDRIVALTTVTREQAVMPAAPGFVYVEVWARPPQVEGGSWRVEGSVSTADHESSARARAGIEAALAELRNDDTALAFEYEELFVAGIDNDPDLTARASAVAESVLGQGSVLPVPAVVPGFSEDFGSFQAKVPGVMFFLGVSNPEKGIAGMPHSPGYAADDDAIVVGARAMAAVLLDFLESRGSHPPRG